MRPSRNISYAPELTSYSNRPRVLIVPKKEPHGLPQLVIEATAAKRGTSVKLFGPLMGTAEAPAITRDVGALGRRRERLLRRLIPSWRGDRVIARTDAVPR